MPLSQYDRLELRLIRLLNRIGGTADPWPATPHDLDRDRERVAIAIHKATGLSRSEWKELRGKPEGEPYLEETIAALAAVQVVAEGAAPGPPAQAIQPPTHDETTAEQYITLDQAAALVNRNKKTLERYLNHPKSEAARMPKPDVEGGGGKPHEWRWANLRPWLEVTFGKKLPDRLPSRGSRPLG
jgi:hypothetical protein